MLLTKTTELAIQSLIYIALQPEGALVNPQQIAGRLRESPTYLAKVLRTVAQAGILRSHRGMAGGFELARGAKEISLLEIVEACQGTIPGNYCRDVLQKNLKSTCGYHRAMHELQVGVRTTLARWNLAQLLAPPRARGKRASACRLNLLLKP